MRFSIFLIFIGSCFISCNTKSAKKNLIIISNETPRLDEKGKIVDAHDGRVIQFNNSYYWYGTAYGNTNGFTTTNYYQVYSSKDLKTWKKEGRLLPNQPEGVYYRPHVIYNEKTKKYVLWYNWYPKLWDGQFGVAISDSPTGPFTILNDNVKMVRSDVGLGDFGLFVDDDKTAYISYNTIQNHQVSIEKLNDDYTASTLENGGIIAEHMEAGSQFKRNNKYYLLTDYTCCFCNYGSGARVYISDDPFRGYKLTGNINRYPGEPLYVLTDSIKRGTQYTSLQKKDSIFESLHLVLDRPSEISELKLYQFTGNRHENCGNVENPRVHPKIGNPEFEIEYWDISEWKAVNIKSVNVEKSALQQQHILQFKTIKTSKLKVRPNSKYNFDVIFLNEIEVGNVAFAAFKTGSGVPEKPIIPAQQTYVMQLQTANGNEYIWMGDLWGSASDNIKGHDYQYWSAPLQFNKDGTIKPMKWTNEWTFTPKN